MQPWDIITTLESDNSRLFKEGIILQEAQADNVLFFDGLQLCLNSLITFGIKQLPIASVDGPGVTWDQFNVLATALKHRELTGNAARDSIQSFMEQCTIEEWNNWYRRILDKDLKCGVSEKTVNNVVKQKFPQFTVPVFSVQLAKDSADHESKMIGKKLIDNKYDGVRVITIVYPDGTVGQFSRNGKEFFNYPLIKQQFSNSAKQLDQAYVFDGEVVGQNFQSVMKQLYRKENIVTDDSVLYLFDMIPLDDFEKGYCDIPQSKRLEMLNKWCNDNIFMAMVNIQVVQQELVDLDTDEGKARFKKINEDAISAGLEGIMIKDPDSPYELKRSASWLKKKPVISVDLTVINVEEGTGKYVGKMGALVCSGIDQERSIDVNCGSGFTDDQRQEFWDNKVDVIGQTVEVLADAITMNQDGTYSLRFPRFKCFRDDK